MLRPTSPAGTSGPPTRPGRRPLRCLAAAAAVAALLLLSPAPGRAGAILDVVVQDSTPVGSTGSFDILLKLDPSSTVSSVTVSGFAVDVTIPDASKVSFTGIGQDITLPNTYIFSSNANPPTFLPATTNTSVEVAGNDLADSGGTLIDATHSYGLAHVTYSVVLGATGDVPVSLVLLPPDPNGLGGTSFSDDSLPQPQAIPFTPIDGTIHLGGVAPVPEPSTLVAAALGIATAAFGRRFGRRRPETPRVG